MAAGIRQLRYHALEGWRVVLRRQLEREGWSLSREYPPMLPQTYHQVTHLGIVAVERTITVS